MTTAAKRYVEADVKSMDAPSNKMAAITPHDTNELAYITRGIYVGGAGNIVIVPESEDSAGTAVTFTGVPAGTILPVRARVIKSSSTTATNIVALY